jgi:hypothetical protein
MTTAYAGEIADCYDAFKEAGAQVSIARANQGAYDALTDTTVPTPPAITGSYAIGVKSNPQKYAALGLEVVSPQEIKLAAQGLTFDPRVGDTFVWAGVTYTVKYADPLQPDGTAIFWRLVGSTA